MKFSSINGTYLLLAGIVLVVIALVAFMWLDARNLNKSVLAKAETQAKQKVQRNSGTQVQINSTNQASNLGSQKINKQPQQQRSDPREAVRRNEEPYDPYAKPGESSRQNGPKEGDKKRSRPPLEIIPGESNAGNLPAGE